MAFSLSLSLTGRGVLLELIPEEARHCGGAPGHVVHNAHMKRVCGVLCGSSQLRATPASQHEVVTGLCHLTVQVVGRGLGLLGPAEQGLCASRDRLGHVADAVCKPALGAGFLVGQGLEKCTGGTLKAARPNASIKIKFPIYSKSNLIQSILI